MEVFTLLTLTLTGLMALLSPPHTAAGQFQQFNPAAGQNDPWTKIKPQNLWTKPTPDPWTRKVSKDPWTRVTKDPWTMATKDPWKRVAGDPWTRAAGDPWTRATGDPWTKRTTVAPRANPTTRDPWTPSATPDPWTKPPTVKSYPDFDAINTINVISSVYFNSKDEKKEKSGRQGGAVSGSTARCQSAIRDCSLFDVDAAALDDVYQQAFATLLQKQRLTHQGKARSVLNWANVCSPNILRKLRRTMISFLIELLVHRTWFGQFDELYFVLNWLVMRCKLARTCGRRAADNMIENVI